MWPGNEPLATAVALIDGKTPTRRDFLFFADGSVLYHDEQDVEYHRYEGAWPFVLDFISIRDEKLFHQLFQEWDD